MLKCLIDRQNNLGREVVRVNLLMKKLVNNIKFAKPNRSKSITQSILIPGQESIDKRSEKVETMSKSHLGKVVKKANQSLRNYEIG